MIVVDIETSGLEFGRCGIWQIGAVDFENPNNCFLEESRIDNEDEIVNSGKRPVLEVIGKTEDELRDKNKQSQKQLLQNFFEWCGKVRIKNFVCENPQFDLAFIKTKAEKYGLKLQVHYRAFDLHSIAQIKYIQIHGNFLIKEDYSDLGLTNTLGFVGMKDDRKEHNALEDAKLTAECFSRIAYGKSLFEEFAKFEVPEYLKT